MIYAKFLSFVLFYYNLKQVAYNAQLPCVSRFTQNAWNKNFWLPGYFHQGQCLSKHIKSTMLVLKGVTFSSWRLTSLVVFIPFSQWANLFLCIYIITSCFCFYNFLIALFLPLSNKWRRLLSLLLFVGYHTSSLPGELRVGGPYSVAKLVLETHAHTKLSESRCIYISCTWKVTEQIIC